MVDEGIGDTAQSVWFLLEGFRTLWFSFNV